jgi:hypothetical protein
MFANSLSITFTEHSYNNTSTNDFKLRSDTQFYESCLKLKSVLPNGAYTIGMRQTGVSESFSFTMTVCIQLFCGNTATFIPTQPYFVSFTTDNKLTLRPIPYQYCHAIVNIDTAILTAKVNWHAIV